MLNDILISSPGRDIYLTVIDNFEALCVDLIPVVLALDIQLKPEELKHIEEMIATILNGISPERLCQQNFFSDINEIKSMIQYKEGNSDLGYYLLYKFFFYKHLFSANKWLYELLAYNKKIKNDFEFITEPQQRLEYTFKLKKGKPIWIFEIPPVYSYLSNLYSTRTIAKLVLLLIKAQKYGMNSPDFLNLKGTDLFINEMTGKPFNFEKDPSGNLKLYLKENEIIELKGIHYNSDFKRNLSTLRQILLKNFVSTENYLSKKYSNNN
jgi:hypothetical protein